MKRELIGDRLLQALASDGSAAILFSKEDLELLIKVSKTTLSVEILEDPRWQSMCDGFQELYDACFG
jgi:hypothetical protein